MSPEAIKNEKEVLKSLPENVKQTIAPWIKRFEGAITLSDADIDSLSLEELVDLDDDIITYADITEVYATEGESLGVSYTPTEIDREITRLCGRMAEARWRA